MQFPLNLVIGGREISTHLVMELLSIFIGFRYYLFIRKRTPDLISTDDRWKIFAAVCFGALVGSRLIGVLEDPAGFAASGNKFMYIFSNKTIVGGLLGGLWCVEFIKKKIGVSSSSGDMMTYPIILGLMLGRIGCFCEGLNDGVIGRKTLLFTGVNFGDGVPRHPLPLYEMVFLGVLWFVIHRLSKRFELADGGKFKIFMVSYLFYRFSAEFLKDNSFTFLHLSTIQFATLAGMFYYYRIVFKPSSLFE